MVTLNLLKITESRIYECDLLTLVVSNQPLARMPSRTAAPKTDHFHNGPSTPGRETCKASPLLLDLLASTGKRVRAIRRQGRAAAGPPHHFVVLGRIERKLGHTSASSDSRAVLLRRAGSQGRFPVSVVYWRWGDCCFCCHCASFLINDDGRIGIGFASSSSTNCEPKQRENCKSSLHNN